MVDTENVLLCDFCVMARQTLKLQTKVLYYLEPEDALKFKCKICGEKTDKLLFCEVPKKGEV